MMLRVSGRLRRAALIEPLDFDNGPNQLDHAGDHSYGERDEASNKNIFRNGTLPRL